MAPVVRELLQNPLTEVEIVVTGQHRSILDQVLQLFKIQPDRDLEVMRPRQSLFRISVATLEGMESVLAESRAEVTLVQGDTTTAFISGLASFYAKIPVGHVEAGLRTEDVYEPFPEEMNRRLLSTLAHLHFAPTKGALENLLADGIPRSSIYVTGNTVTDALVQIAADLPPGLPSDLVDLPSGARYLFVETHRRENLGAPMREICLALKELLEEFGDLHVIFSVHPNPAVRDVVFPVLEGVPRAHLLEPVDYPTLIRLVRESYLVLTDSGGIQEEAPSLGKPVLVLRRQTERPEGVEAGVAELVGTDRSLILRRVRDLFRNEEAYRRMSMVQSPYGDAQAARRTVEALLHEFRGLESRPVEFCAELSGTRA